MNLQLHSRLSHLYRVGRIYRHFWRAERTILCRAAPLHQRVALWMSGFNSNKQHLYDFGSHARQEYWRDIDVYRIQSFNVPHATLLRNKDILHTLLAYHQIGPPVLGIIADNRYYAVGDPTGRPPKDTLAQLPSHTLLHALSDTGCDGTLLCKTESGYNACNVASAPSNKDGRALSGLLCRGYWQVLAHTPINPKSVQTAPSSLAICPLYMITFQCSEVSAPFIGFAIQLIDADTPLYCCVNTESGVMSAAAEMLESPPYKRCYDVHPESGITLAGQAIEDWAGACSLALRAHTLIPSLTAITWHLLPGSAGWQVVDASPLLPIEWAQLHGPLPHDRRMADHLRSNSQPDSDATESGDAS